MSKSFSFIFILSIIFLSSCIQTPSPDVPKRISFRLNVDNVGQSIQVSQDSIRVQQIKFLADKINITLPDSVILQTGVDALVMNYRSEFQGDDQNILTANVGFEDINEFAGMDLFIAPPQGGDNIQDTEFFGDPNNFSYIIRGTFNGESFDFKSSISFEKSYTFNNTVQLNDEIETMIIRLTSDVRQIFVDSENNRILDPAIEDNKAVLNTMFKNSISVEASASDEIF